MTPTSDLVHALRDAFDQTFAEHEPVRTRPTELVVVTIGGHDVVVPLADVAAVGRTKPLALPGTGSLVLGVQQLGRALVPVWDLAALLGQPRSGSPTWVWVAARHPSVGFAVTALRRHTADASTSGATAGATTGLPCTAGVVPVGGDLLPRLDVDSLHDRVRHHARPAQES
jgi:chemotaxis signal transduction protein